MRETKEKNGFMEEKGYKNASKRCSLMDPFMSS